MSDMTSERDQDISYFGPDQLPKPVYLPTKRKCARCNEWKEDVYFCCKECRAAMGIRE